MNDTMLGDMLRTGSPLEGRNKSIGIRNCTSAEIGAETQRRWFRSIEALIFKSGEMIAHRHRIALLVALAALAVAALGIHVAQAQIDSSRGAALDDIGSGTAAFRSGDIVAATRHWSDAIRVCRSIGDVDLEAQALARRGEAYRVEGYLRDAEIDLQAALVKAEQSGDQVLIAASSGALGNLAFMKRRTAVAEPLLNRSRDLASRLSDSTTLAATDNDLGNLYASTGRPVEAANAYARAIASAEAARDDALTATAEINAARLALRRKDAAGATALLVRAVDTLERSPPSYYRGIALVSAGSAVFEGEESLSRDAQAVAYRAFRAAADTADALHNAALTSLAQGSLAHLYERTNRLDEASTLTDRAAFAAQQASAPGLSFRWEWQRARLALSRGQTDTALVSYRRAVSELQSVRQDIPVEYRDGRSSYRATFGPLYLEFSDLLLRRASSDEAQARPLIREARDTIEQLKETELQDYFRDSCVTSFEAKRRPIETIAPRTAVLYPISLPDRLEMLVSFGEEQQQFTIGVPEATLRQEVRRFRELLEKRTTNEYLVPARQLYDQIIRPLEPVLAAHRVDTLVVVPDEVLRIVPFAAFHDGTGFLLDHYASAVAPSLKLVEPKSLTPKTRTALVLGISQSVQGYVDLPNVPHEVAAVHAVEGGDVLLNDAFTRSRFASDLKSGRYNIVHIASHGQFGADPSQTFVLAFDGPLSMDDLEADVKYGPARENPLELLILSACETASGDDRAALGLAGVALKAGARSALATLWYISDLASGDLVTDFYRGLQSGGQSKAQALRAAQRALAGDPRFAHPAYWAPFLLIGDWL
jgi:CHAT domain-containing protein